MQPAPQYIVVTQERLDEIKKELEKCKELEALKGIKQAIAKHLHKQTGGKC